MAGVDSTSVGKILKDLWPDGVHEEILKESALLAMMPKDKKFNGRSKYIDVVYSGNRARSASYSNARSNGSTTQNLAFQITRKPNYSFGTINREVMLASAAGNKGALVDALALESKMMVSAFKQDLSADVYSDGSGVRGQIAASGISSAVITLTDANSSVHFEVGDILVLSPNADGSSVRTGSVTVSKVNRDAGTITCSGNVTTGIAAAAAADYIYKQGDAAAKPTGIGGWVPATAPQSGESFFGVDRSADVTRLGGIRFDGTSLNHEEAIIKGLLRASRDQAFPKDLFMHPDDVGALELLLGSRKMYEDVEAGNFGFTALKVNGPRGTVRIYADGWATKGYAFGLSLENWLMNSLGEVPDWVTEDGAKLSRQTTADGFEFMLAGYYQFSCEAPGQQLRIALAAV